jgi:hypothetical protein
MELVNIAQADDVLDSLGRGGADGANLDFSRSRAPNLGKGLVTSPISRN